MLVFVSSSPCAIHDSSFQDLLPSLQLPKKQIFVLFSKRFKIVDHFLIGVGFIATRLNERIQRWVDISSDRRIWLISKVQRDKPLDIILY